MIPIHDAGWMEFTQVSRQWTAYDTDRTANLYCATTLLASCEGNINNFVLSY